MGATFLSGGPTDGGVDEGACDVEDGDIEVEGWRDPD